MGSHNARNTNIMGSCLFFFILEHSITFCSYLLWVQEDGRKGIRIVYPVEKNMDAARI
jgi:hypothetical protein